MEFKFIQDPISKKWVISAPKREKRPNESRGTEPICPFCVGSTADNKLLYSIPNSISSGSIINQSDNWKIKVVENKYPFAPIHEIIIHSPDHHKSFDELPLLSSELILKTFKERFIVNQDKGSVYIFTNHGEEAGESLPHPHSQLVVIPDYVSLEFPHHNITDKDKVKETAHFSIFCPYESKWPDEVWIYPKKRDNFFGEIIDEQIKDLAKVLYRIIQIMDLRHGHEFPYNLSIYPYKDWYLRLIPRIKVIGGFEVGTNVFVNTQDPNETIEFILEHFDSPDEEKIKTSHRADYRRRV